MQTEFVKFRLVLMPCCGHLLCWVNPRNPNYCPECGQSTGAGKLFPQNVMFSDNEARLIHKNVPTASAQKNE